MHHPGDAVLCQAVLLRATDSRVPVDDTLFIEWAVRSACPLVTFDNAVSKAFPEITCRPRDLTRH